jgi:hypothetical protein
MLDKIKTYNDTEKQKAIDIIKKSTKTQKQKDALLYYINK